MTAKLESQFGIILTVGACANVSLAKSLHPIGSEELPHMASVDSLLDLFHSTFTGIKDGCALLGLADPDVQTPRKCNFFDDCSERHQRRGMEAVNMVKQQVFVLGVQNILNSGI